MIRFGEGRGKLLLFGEHAAVYGHPAVGVPLAVQTKLVWSEKELPPNYRTETGKDKEVSEALLALLPGILEHLGYEGRAGCFKEGRIGKASSVPRVGGFGSSAAFCVALSRIALDSFSSDYDPAVHRLANELEKYFHHTPSGVDTGLACDKGASAWFFENTDGLPSRQTLRIPNWPLIYGALPRDGNTGALVAGIRQRVVQGDMKTRSGIQALGRLSREFIRLARQTRDSGAFALQSAQMVDEAQKRLRALDLSNRELDRLFDLAKKHGALAGKLSGAGGGGAFYLSFASIPSRDDFLQRFPAILGLEGFQLAGLLTELNVS